MNILILQGSPNLSGSTSMMVEQFAKGAKEAGHTCKRVDITELDISPCTGCVACGYEGPCTQSDSMDLLRSQILKTDMLVFATPLYYYGMSAQLKTVVDRFCSANYSITAKRLKSVLLTVAWNSDNWTFDALVAHYKTLVRYLDLQDQGMVLGYGCGTPAMTKRSNHLREAYELGKTL